MFGGEIRQTVFNTRKERRYFKTPVCGDTIYLVGAKTRGIVFKNMH